MLEPKLLHSIRNQLLHVESVKGDCGIGETLHHNLMHALREVHRHLTHLAAQVPMDVHDCLHNVLYLGTAYDCNQRTPTAVGILVGDYCVQVSVGQGCLIDTEIRTYVTREDKPLLCMGLMLPSAEITQVILV